MIKIIINMTQAVVRNMSALKNAIWTPSLDYSDERNSGYHGFFF